MKTIQSEIDDAKTKWYMWIDIANDIEALNDRGKTEEQAMCLSNYFEGKYDGLHRALKCLRAIGEG